MKQLIALCIAALITVSLTSAFADTSERLKAAGENIQGTAQEAAGEVTNDPELKAKGQLNKAKGNLRNTKEDVKDKVLQ